MTWLAAYFAAGAFVGILAGMLGIGGGMSLVPILAALFAAQGFAPDHTVHLAVGTGMASVLATGTASAREHHRHGAVDWGLVRVFAPGMVLGTLASALFAGIVSQRALAIAFAVIVICGATQILSGYRPAGGGRLPGPLGTSIAGFLIGIASGLVAAGGTFLSVPFMLFCGVALHTAIGTGAAAGVPVAVVGTIGYVASGWNVPGLPSHAIGFVHLPALAMLMLATTLTAPAGARMAHRMPVLALRRIFAGLLYLLAIKMWVTYW